MPFYATAQRPFITPDAHAVGGFFLDARAALPDLPLLLGCARPPGRVKAQIDAYAVMAGLNGIAHPADGIVELATRLQRKVRVTPSCCSIALGDEVMALDQLAPRAASVVPDMVARQGRSALAEIGVAVR